MDKGENKQFLMDVQKYKHPGIRRASWNPEVAENVAGRLIPKPRKASCASLDLPPGLKRLNSCGKVAEDNSQSEQDHPSHGEEDILRISAGKQLFIPQKRKDFKEEENIAIDVPGCNISDTPVQVLEEMVQGDSTSPNDDDPAKMPKITKATLESFQNLGSGLVKTFRSFTARKQ